MSKPYPNNSTLKAKIYWDGYLKKNIKYYCLDLNRQSIDPLSIDIRFLKRYLRMPPYGGRGGGTKSRRRYLILLKNNDQI